MMVCLAVAPAKAGVQGTGIAGLRIPAFAQGCPGKVEELFVRAFCSEFYLQKPLARARPGHPRLDATAISVKKTWVAGPSPAKGIRSGCTGSWPHNPFPFPGQPCAFAGMMI